MSLAHGGSATLGIILAGGRSERFSHGLGLPKALAPINGVPMVIQVAARLAAGGAERIVILSGANHKTLCEELQIWPDLGALDLENGERVPVEVRYSGDTTGTAGRLLALDRDEIGQSALLSYTDVLSDAALPDLTELCQTRDAAIAALAVNPRLPWGEFRFQGEEVAGFEEKAVDTSRWINGGIFAVSADILGFIRARDEMLEEAPMARMIAAQRVAVLKHAGWWCSVDTAKALREVQECPQAALYWYGKVDFPCAI